MRKYLALLALVGLVGCGSSGVNTTIAAGALTYTAGATAYEQLCQHQTVLPAYCTNFYNSLVTARDAIVAANTANEAGKPTSAVVTTLNKAISDLNTFITSYAPKKAVTK